MRKVILTLSEAKRKDLRLPRAVRTHGRGTNKLSAGAPEMLRCAQHELRADEP